jgi:hypothetical protein
MSHRSSSSSPRALHLLPTALLGLCLALSGCVIYPAWGDEPLSRDTAIDFSGATANAGISIRIQAWNLSTNAWNTLRTFNASTGKVATSPDLFGWSAPDVVIPNAYWGPGTRCTPGMANLRVVEVNANGSLLEMATFDEAGRDCLFERMNLGEHAINAGNACKYPDPRIVLFSQPC